jgi:hypothetical protein
MWKFNLQTPKLFLYLHPFQGIRGDTQAANEGRL